MPILRATLRPTATAARTARASAAASSGNPTPDDGCGTGEVPPDVSRSPVVAETGATARRSPDVRPWPLGSAACSAGDATALPAVTTCARPTCGSRMSVTDAREAGSGIDRRSTRGLPAAGACPTADTPSAEGTWRVARVPSVRGVCAGVDIRATSATARARRGTGPSTTTFTDRPVTGRPVTAALTEMPGVSAGPATAPSMWSISTPGRTDAGAAGIVAGESEDGASTEGAAGGTAVAGAAPFAGGADDAGASAAGGVCTTPDGSA